MVEGRCIGENHKQGSVEGSMVDLLEKLPKMSPLVHVTTLTPDALVTAEIDISIPAVPQALKILTQ